MKQIERHWHWSFTAWDGERDARELFFAVTVDVIGFLCEADARIAAQDIVKRDQYALRKVWECASCGYMQQQIGVLNDLVTSQQ